jgi:hypothetical protein
MTGKLEFDPAVYCTKCRKRISPAYYCPCDCDGGGSLGLRGLARGEEVEWRVSDLRLPPETFESEYRKCPECGEIIRITAEKPIGEHKVVLCKSGHVVWECVPYAVRKLECSDSHPPFITVYKAVCGWQTMMMVWDIEMQGYDVAGTGMGPYGSEIEKALGEAFSWSEDENIQIKLPPELEGMVKGKKSRRRHELEKTQ